MGRDIDTVMVLFNELIPKRAHTSFEFSANLFVNNFGGKNDHYLTFSGNKGGFVNFYCQIKHSSRRRGVRYRMFYTFLTALQSKGSGQDHGSSLKCYITLSNLFVFQYSHYKMEFWYFPLYSTSFRETQCVLTYSKVSISQHLQQFTYKITLKKHYSVLKRSLLFDQMWTQVPNLPLSKSVT